MAAEDFRQVLLQQGEILCISGPVLQAVVQVARRLRGRVVALLVHREREDVGVVPEDRRRPVAVMDVQIDDRRPPHDSLAL